jgi:hypothetical protein
VVLVIIDAGNFTEVDMASSVYAVLMQVIGRDEKVLVHAMKAWGVEVCLHSLLISALGVVGWSASRPGYFTSEETPVSIELEAGWAPEPV